MSGLPSASSRSSSRSTSPSTTSPASPEALEQYEHLMRSLLPLPAHFMPHPKDDSEDEDDGKPMTKAEKQNAKKKRRKERERLARLQEEGLGKGAVAPKAVEFRLFSSCPVREVALEREIESWASVSNPRHQPISSSEDAKRRRIAIQSAVEFPSLGGPSTLALKWTKSDKPSRPVLPPLTGPAITPSPIMQLTIPRESIRYDAPLTESKPHKIPHTTTYSAITPIPSIIIDVPSAALPSPARGKRKRRPAEPHAPAKFWAPDYGLGGKCRGYGWGYWGSLEGAREGGYVRSKNR